MPQFDPNVIEPQLVWLAISFGLFYFLMARLALPRISGMLQERVERVADDLDQAEALKRESDEVREAREAALAEARAAAARTVAEATARARADAEARLAALDAKLAQETAAATARIAEEQAAARREIDRVAAEGCREIVKKLVGEAVAASVTHKAVKDAMASLRRGEA
ncbi:MAG: ATP F0F1 synthase subunit B [Rhodothalassiaceae bacterium]